MTTLNEYFEQQMKNEEFKSEYEKLQPELNLIRALIDARNSCNMTQKELAERTDMMLKIEFVPKTSLHKR